MWNDIEKKLYWVFVFLSLLDNSIKFLTLYVGINLVVALNNLH